MQHEMSGRYASKGSAEPAHLWLRRRWLILRDSGEMMAPSSKVVGGGGSDLAIASWTGFHGCA